MPKGRFLLAVVVICSFAAVALGSDWPRFRGPNGTGVSDARTIPVVWTAQDILWKTPLPGPGNSSPVVWKGSIFVQSTSKDGNERTLLCYDAKDGSLKWSDTIKGKIFKKMHAKNTLASQSPTVDSDHVYVAFWDGERVSLSGYTHAGQRLWNRDLGTFTSQHGAGASPIAYGGKVYFNDDQDTKAQLLCLDGKTGDTVWSVTRPFYRACYATPIFRTLPNGGRTELIVDTTKGITGYDPETGNKLWNYDWVFKQKLFLRTTGSPVCENGILFANSGDSPAGPRHTIAIRLGESPTLLWENLKDFPYISSILADGKHVYAVSDSGFAGCFEAESGKRVWFERLDGDFSSSPILIDGKIYVVNEEGDVYVLKADPSGFQKLAKNPLGETVRATPAVADERLFIRGYKHLFCIGKK